MDANLGVDSSAWAELPEWPSPDLVCTMRMGFPGGSEVKNPLAEAGDVGSISGSEKSPGRGNDNPLQYSCPGNPTDRGAS